jgi:hypothetical protein
MTLEEFRRRLSNATLILCVSFVALFAGDYAVLRYRFAARGVDAATAKLVAYDAARLKDSKFSVFYDQPRTQTCVKAIFPWLGLEPCWYARRHSVRILNGALQPELAPATDASSGICRRL